MINLLVDEGYAFDYLSVLEVKKHKSKESHEPWIKCYQYLQNQFDSKKWFDMINSNEYQDMIKANTLTFDAVDKAKNNEVTAKYVDDCNYKRYLAKKSFQDKFFNTELSEKKIGYNK